MSTQTCRNLGEIEELLEAQLAAVQSGDMDSVESLSAKITEKAAQFDEIPRDSEEHMARIKAMNEKISLALAVAREDVARELAGVRKARQLMSYKTTGQSE